ERTFDRVFAVEDAGQAADVVFREIFGPPLRIDLRLAAQLQGRGRTDSVDVAKRNMGRFVVRKVHAENTRHLVSLPLALFMPRIAANHVQPAVAAHDLAVFANTFDAGAHFHGRLVLSENDGNYHCSKGMRPHKGKNRAHPVASLFTTRLGERKEHPQISPISRIETRNGTPGSLHSSRKSLPKA